MWGGLPAQPDGHHPRLEQGCVLQAGATAPQGGTCLVCDSGLHGPDSPRSPEIHGCVATPGGDPAARTAICCSLGFRMAILREATCCTYNINMGVMRCGAPSRMLCKHPWVLASAGLCMQCGLHVQRRTFAAEDITAGPSRGLQWGVPALLSCACDMLWRPFHKL